MTQPVLFYLFSLVAVLSGFSVITARNPITSALSLVLCFFCLAADYVLLDAHFVAVIQVLVYAGAIMVLFIFVIMLLNIRDDIPSPLGDIPGRAIFGLVVAGVMGIGLITAIDKGVHDTTFTAVDENFGTIETVGKALFQAGGPFLLPFEVISALLTVAVIGAVVLAKKEI
jgi:NADH-quinone oxidoreductase subunit J